MALKILLADDSMTAQNMGKRILTDAGYNVTTVSNGAAAIKKFAEIQPDILLLDIYMPGYNGLEVCEKVKNAPETARTPVLLTVGKLEPFRPEDGMKVKADGLIIKPFEASDLIAVVGKLAERVIPATPVVVEPAPAAAAAHEYGFTEVEEPEEAPPAVDIPQEIAAAPALMDDMLEEPASEFQIASEPVAELEGLESFEPQADVQEVSPALELQGFDESFENSAATSDFAATVEPAVAEASLAPEVDLPADPVFDAPADPVLETPADPVFDAPVDPVLETPADPVDDAPANPDVDLPADPMLEVVPAAAAPEPETAEESADPLESVTVAEQAPAAPSVASTPFGSFEIRLEPLPEEHEVEYTSAPPVGHIQVEPLPDVEPDPDVRGAKTPPEIKSGVAAALPEIVFELEDEPADGEPFGELTPNLETEARLEDALEAYDVAAATPEPPPVADGLAVVSEAESVSAAVATPEPVTEVMAEEVVSTEAVAPEPLDAAPPAPKAFAAAAWSVPSGAPAPLGKTSLDDDFSRMLDDIALQAAPVVEPATESPCCVDDVEDALGLSTATVPEAETTALDAEDAEERDDFVLPPREERMHVTFAPDIEDALEIVAENYAKLDEAHGIVESGAAVTALAEPEPEPPVAVCTEPGELAASEFAEATAVADGAATAGENEATAQVVGEVPAVLAMEVEAQRAQAAEPGDEQNEAMAEQIAERLLQRMRPQLIEEIKKALSE